MSEKIKILDPAFEYANEYVLENTRSPGLGRHFHRLVRLLGDRGYEESNIRRGARVAKAHWFVVFDEVAYDSDTTKEGFAPFE
jgi:hypothetical protein